MAHTAAARANPSFCIIEWLGKFLLPPGWDAGPALFAGAHLYTWVKRGTVKVKCLAQEHNAVP